MTPISKGPIPQGQYGADAVLAWDAGRYRPLIDDMSDALRRGHVSVWLEGEKLTGGFPHTRIREGKGETWLVVKKADEHANTTRDPVRAEPASVRTGRTLADVAVERLPMRRRRRS